jgi:HemY protein
MLAKHQGFTAGAAEGLLRTLATESLSTARDADQLRAMWQSLDARDRRDAIVVAHAARRMAELGSPVEARQWLAPMWDRIQELSPDGVDALARSLNHCLLGLEPEWLQRLDASTAAALRNPGLALAVGLALTERQLWGKARGMLLSAANDLQLDLDRRRLAWAKLGQMAEREHQAEEAARYFRLAALPDSR